MFKKVAKQLNKLIQPWLYWMMKSDKIFIMKDIYLFKILQKEKIGVGK